jgi:hypothetical protein
VDLKEMECEDVDWIYLAQDKGRVAGPCGYGNRPLRCIEFWEYLHQLNHYHTLYEDRHQWDYLTISLLRSDDAFYVTPFTLVHHSLDPA